MLPLRFCCALHLFFFLIQSFTLGDKIELLILKAKRNLEHCSEELPKSTKKDDSPCSLDKLEAERSWENIPVTLYVSYNGKTLSFPNEKCHVNS